MITYQAPYDIVLVDFAWSYSAWSDKGKGRDPENHYQTMPNQRFTELMRLLLPLCSERVLIAAWVTNPLKVEFANLITQWQNDPNIGLQYKSTLFTWLKLNNNQAGANQTGFVQHKALADESSWFHGLGRYTRQNTEEVWALRRNKFKPLPRLDKSVGQIIVAPRQRHSRKPEETHERLTRMYGDLPRLELFARPPFVEGWEVMGNEVNGKDIFDSLAEKKRELS